MISVRPMREGELLWVNARYAEVNFLPSTEADSVWVAEVDGMRAGMGRLVSVTGTVSASTSDEAELSGILVVPECRGKGVAAHIVAALLAASAHARLYCIPFAHLASFYMRYGFTPVPEDVELPCAITRKLRWCGSEHAATDVRLLWRQGLGQHKGGF